jgi:TRAP-type transport system periplasmic protein
MRDGRGREYSQIVKQVACIALAMLCCSCGAAADRTPGGAARHPVVLTLGSPADTLVFESYAKAVDRLSAGRLRIAIQKTRRSGAGAESEHDFVRDVRSGRVDLGGVASRGWDVEGAKSFAALNAPLLIDSFALEDAVLRSDITKPMLRSLHPLDLAGIAVVPGPLRRPFGVTRPLAAPDDYRGLRIGTFESHVAEATMRTLGAAPVDVPISAPITGLDGIEAHLTSIQGNGYDGRGGFLTMNVALWARPVVLFASARRFASLTATQRRILQRAASDVLSSQIDKTESDEFADAAILCRRGRTRFLNGDASAMRRAVEPVYRQLERDPATAAAIKAIEDLKRRTGAPADGLAACDTPPARTPPTAVTPFDGVYRMVTSMRRDSHDDPEPVPENYGVWTFVFTRGRFAISQEYGPACTWGYGSYTVVGDRVEWLFTDGGGIAPNDAMNKPGEDFFFRWNRYRDALTLGPSAAGYGAENFRLRPWRRIASAPTRRYFAKRCPPPAKALP